MLTLNKVNIAYNIVKLLAFFGITVSFARFASDISEKSSAFMSLFSEMNTYVALGTGSVGLLFAGARFYTYIRYDIPNKRKKEKLEIELMIQELKSKTRHNLENKIEDVEDELNHMKKKLKKLIYGKTVIN